jgi:hypothetical protein
LVANAGLFYLNRAFTRRPRRPPPRHPGSAGGNSPWRWAGIRHGGGREFAPRWAVIRPKRITAHLQTNYRPLFQIGNRVLDYCDGESSSPLKPAQPPEGTPPTASSHLGPHSSPERLPMVARRQHIPSRGLTEGARPWMPGSVCGLVGALAALMAAAVAVAAASVAFPSPAVAKGRRTS